MGDWDLNQKSVVLESSVKLKQL